ncbi:hypothetical protein BDV59DRAFT_111436 [Aspergillus ambiguus]|uniref:uncharacterized protein n=1 Tax=Aspergillus ambiguus TaxID=176160 RepID=UPI003CCE4391
MNRSAASSDVKDRSDRLSEANSSPGHTERPSNPAEPALVSDEGKFASDARPIRSEVDDVGWMRSATQRLRHPIHS